MANDRWTPVDGPSKGDKYSWHSPTGGSEHEEQTVSPSDLAIKPKDFTLKPTLQPERSGIQWGSAGWDFASENTPDQSWYIQTTPEDD